jgi:PhnB protein
MTITPYLSFHGDCEAAFRYYQQHLDGRELTLRPFSGSPAHDAAPGGWQDKVMHGSIRIGEQLLMGSDVMSGEAARSMQGCALAITTDNEAEAERMFAALADGGEVSMALAPTFFARRFGTVTDRFKVNWMLICQDPA